MTLVKEIRNFGKSKLTEEQKKKSSAMIETARKADAKLVKGVFKNLESPGGVLQFAHHQYKGEPTRVYTMKDGEECEIPLGVAKHLNTNCKYAKKVYANVLQKNAQGDWKPIPGTPIDRYQFVSGEFM